MSDNEDFLTGIELFAADEARKLAQQQLSEYKEAHAKALADLNTAHVILAAATSHYWRIKNPSGQEPE